MHVIWIKDTYDIVLLKSMYMYGMILLESMFVIVMIIRDYLIYTVCGLFGSDIHLGDLLRS